MNMKVHAGSVIGRSHLLYGKNNQDAYTVRTVTIQQKEYLLGFVSDGCGEGQNSEVGSELGVQFLMREALQLLSWELPIWSLPSALYERLVGYIRDIISLHAFTDKIDEVEFIRNHLLFTVLGFVIGEEEAVVFAAGDGVIVINDEIIIREENNKPLYPAYHLIDREFLKNPSVLPQGFDEYSFNTWDIERIAIGTDSWANEQNILSSVWGLTHPRALQRMMNKLSDKDHRFADDATLIVVEGVSNASHNPKAVDLY